MLISIYCAEIPHLSNSSWKTLLLIDKTWDWGLMKTWFFVDVEEHRRERKQSISQKIKD